jgi:ABC-type transporter Mla subunit MlaD
VGNNLVLAGDYFEQFNPELPTLAEDFRGIADFADNLDAAAPDFLAVLENLSVVNRNLVDQEQELETFLRSTSAVSGTFEDFLEENEDRFVSLAREGRLPLELFARYAPQFPCLAAGIAQSELFIGDAFGTLQPGLHITLEFTQDQGGYLPRQDEPQYLDRRDPVCFGLERLPEGQPDVPAPDINYQDGYNDRNGPDDSQRGEEPEQQQSGSSPRRCRPRPSPSPTPTRSAASSTPPSPPSWAPRSRTSPTSPTCCSAPWPAAPPSGSRPGAPREDLRIAREARGVHDRHLVPHVHAGRHHRQHQLRRQDHLLGHLQRRHGLLTGNDVRIAGVVVGSVDKIELSGRNLAEVEFSLDEGRTIPESTIAALRFRNLVGERYMALTEGEGSAGR